MRSSCSAITMGDFSLFIVRRETIYHPLLIYVFRCLGDLLKATTSIRGHIISSFQKKKKDSIKVKVLFMDPYNKLKNHSNNLMYSTHIYNYVLSDLYDDLLSIPTQLEGKFARLYEAYIDSLDVIARSFKNQFIGSWTIHKGLTMLLAMQQRESEHDLSTFLTLPKMHNRQRMSMFPLSYIPTFIN